MTCAQGLLRLLWGGPEVGVLRDCFMLFRPSYICEVLVPQLQTKPNFDELFFQQDGTSPHYALRVRDYLNKVFTQRWCTVLVNPVSS